MAAEMDSALQQTTSVSSSNDTKSHHNPARQTNSVDHTEVSPAVEASKGLEGQEPISTAVVEPQEDNSPAIEESPVVNEEVVTAQDISTEAMEIEASPDFTDDSKMVEEVVMTTETQSKLL